MLTDFQIQVTEIWIISLIRTHALISTNINALPICAIKFKGVNIYRILGSIPKIMSIPKDSLYSCANSQDLQKKQSTNQHLDFGLTS